MISSSFQTSPDGYIRLRVSQFRVLPFKSLSSEADADLLNDLLNRAIPAYVAGYCEWTSETNPVVSIGFDWYIDTTSNRITVMRQSIRTNLMLVKINGDNYGQHNTNRFIRAWIKKFIRPATNKKRAALDGAQMPADDTDWHQSYLSLLDNLTTEIALYEKVRSEVARLGFIYTAYGIRVPVPITRPTVWMHNNYPPEWQKRYAEKNYLEIDPTVRHGIASSLPIIWSDEVFKDSPEFWADAQAHGLRYGWAQSSRDARGAVGMLSVARSDKPVSNAELIKVQHKLMVLVQILHTGMSKILIDKIAGIDAKLSPLDHIILRWSADGKTVWEISQIVNKSERNISDRRNKLLKKLGASNIVQAVITAYALGIMDA